MSSIPNGYILLTHWPRHYDYPSVSALRWMIFTNMHGFNDKVVRRVGKRILLDPEAFKIWVEEQNAAHNGGKA